MIGIRYSLVVLAALMICPGRCMSAESEGADPAHREMLKAVSQARQAQQAGKLAAAARLYERALSSAEALPDLEKRVPAIIKVELGELYCHLGRVQEGVPVLEEAVAALDKVLAEDDVQLAVALTKLGGGYLIAAQFKQALPPLERTVGILKQTDLPRKHVLVCLAYHQLAVAYVRTGQREKSVELDLENLRHREEALGKEHQYVLLTLENLVASHHRLERYKKSLEYAELWLERNKKGLGDGHPHMERVLNEAGAACASLGRPEDAVGHYQRAVEVQEEQGRPSTRYTVSNVCLLARQLQTTLPPRFEEAERWARRAVEITTSVTGQTSRDTAVARGILGSILKRNGKHEECEQLLLEWIATGREAAGEEDPSTLAAVSGLVDLYIETGRHEEALPWIDLLMPVTEIDCGRLQEEIVHSLLYGLGDVYREKGDLETGRDRVERVLGKLEERLAEKQLEWAAALSAAGEAYIAFNRFELAESHFQRALEVRRAVQGAESLVIAHAEGRVGQACMLQNRYGEAERRLRSSVEMYDRLLRRDKGPLAQPLMNLGFSLERLDRCGEAEEALRRALEIGREHLGEDDKTVGSILACLGRLCTRLGRYDEAEQNLHKAIAIQEKISGKDSFSVAWYYLYLGQLFHEKKDLEKAEQRARQALAIFEATVGPDHPDASVAISTLADVCAATDRMEEASRLYDRALRIPGSTASLKPRDRMIMQEEAAGISILRGDVVKGSQQLIEARRAARDWIDGALSGMSAEEQLLYLERNEKRSLYVALSSVLTHRSEQAMIDAGAECLINGKAMGSEFLAGEIALARESDDPQVATLREELAGVREQLTRIALRPPGSAPFSLRKQRELLVQERDLMRRLGQTVDDSTRSEWVELETVRAAVPKDAVVIDLAVFPYVSLSVDTPPREAEPARYVAWIIPPAGEGEVRLVDLGSAAEIDRAVAEARLTMEPTPRHSVEYMKNATAISRRKCARLTELVWEPMREAVAGRELVLVSPTAGLWLFPWEAFTVAEDGYLIEEMEISYLVSSREVLTKPAATSSTSAALFSFPDYNYVNVTVELDAESGWERFLQNWVRKRTTGLLDGAGFLPLVDNRRELAKIAAVLDDRMQVESRFYLAREAQESRFKELQSPRFLFLNTHGFFLPDQAFDQLPDTAKGDRRWQAVNRWRFEGEGRGKTLVVANPLMRCGLALAGANRQANAFGGNDGILTGLEILGCDLRGTELVVLSACETGEGAVRHGEGVAGLRHAFQLAGARSVISTLWSVRGDVANRLTVTFFEELANGEKATAMRRAKLRLVEELREEEGAAHPRDWAAFTLTGDWR